MDAVIEGSCDIVWRRSAGAPHYATILGVVNPNARSQEDTRTPEELLDLIEAKGREVAEAIAALRKPTGTA